MKRILPLIILAAVLLAACQPAAAPTVEPAQPTPAETATAPGPLHTAAEALPTLDPTAQALFEELQTVWQPVISGGMMNHVVCPMVIGTAEQAAAEAIDAKQAMAEILAQGLLIYSINQAYAEWEPDPAVAPYKDRVLAHAAVIQDVLDRWSASEISEDEIIAILSEECPRSTATAREIIAEARAAGITDEMLDIMLDTLQQGIDTMTGSLQPAP